FLERIKEAFDADKNLENLLLAPYFREVLSKAQKAWRHAVTTAVHLGIWTPAFMTALSYYDGIRQDRLPANLLQAQRDYFGAHTYQRVDRPGTFHTDWLSVRRKPSEPHGPIVRRKPVRLDRQNRRRHRRHGRA